MTISFEKAVISFAWRRWKCAQRENPALPKRQSVRHRWTFAETKEQIGGILLLEANDLNQATELMAKHPGIRVATFEIRPLDEESTAQRRTRPNSCERAMAPDFVPTRAAEFMDCLNVIGKLEKHQPIKKENVYGYRTLSVF